jgi:hypothetical protein
MDPTGCRELNRVLTHNNNVVTKSANPTRRRRELDHRLGDIRAAKGDIKARCKEEHGVSLGGERGARKTGGEAWCLGHLYTLLLGAAVFFLLPPLKRPPSYLKQASLRFGRVISEDIAERATSLTDARARQLALREAGLSTSSIQLTHSLASFWFPTKASGFQRNRLLSTKAPGFKTLEPVK